MRESWQRSTIRRKHRIAMSNRRSKPRACYTQLKRDEAGRALCRWCEHPVPKGRRTFCSKACAHEWNIRAYPGYARRMVEQRDRGVCARCGLDTERIKRISNRLKNLAIGHRDWHQEHAPWLRFPSSAHRLDQLEILSVLINLYMGHWVFDCSSYIAGINRVPHLCRHLWEADHIIPVVEGGGECGLDGYRTLCLHCHKNATMELAARRASAKRPQQELFDRDDSVS